MKRFRAEVWALRVRDAWGAHTGQIPFAASVAMENDLKRTIVPPDIQPRKRVRRETAPTHCVYTDLEMHTGCCVVKSRFGMITGVGMKTDLVNIKVTRTNAKGITMYNGSVNITHDMEGNLFSIPIRLVAPVVRATRPRKEVSSSARDYVQKILFDMYVRVVSYMRRSMFWSGTYQGYDFDMCAHIPAYGCTCEGVEDIQVDMRLYVSNLIRDWCNESGVEFVDFENMSNHTSSSYDDDDISSSHSSQ